MTTPELLPCPFCGKSLRWSDLYREYDHPVSRCFLAGMTIKKTVITAWNTRAPLSPAVLAELPDEVEVIALALYNEYLTSRGMRAVDYIGANQSPNANHFRKLAGIALSAIREGRNG